MKRSTRMSIDGSQDRKTTITLSDQDLRIAIAQYLGLGGREDITWNLPDEVSLTMRIENEYRKYKQDKTQVYN